MDAILDFILSPKFMQVFGPLAVVAIVNSWVVYKLFLLYKDSLEKRLEDWRGYTKNYEDLTAEINRTLDVLLKTLGKRNGNGNGGN